MKKRVAVILSGCGHKDGSEITEAVSTLVVLSELGAEVRVFAPAKDLVTVTGERRSVLDESAWIARSEVTPLASLRAHDFDALVLPGGMGAAKVLSTWASDGASCVVEPELKRVLEEFHREQRPIGAICIAPAIVARVLGHHGVTVTVGRDNDETAAEVRQTGALVEPCAVDDFLTDRLHRLVTTPAYMFAEASPSQVYQGIRAAMVELVEMS